MDDNFEQVANKIIPLTKVKTIITEWHESSNFNFLSFQILLIDDDPVLNFDDFKVNTVWSFLLDCWLSLWEKSWIFSLLQLYTLYM